MVDTYDTLIRTLVGKQSGREPSELWLLSEFERVKDDSGINTDHIVPSSNS